MESPLAAPVAFNPEKIRSLSTGNHRTVNMQFWESSGIRRERKGKSFKIKAKLSPKTVIRVGKWKDVTWIKKKEEW